MPGGTASATGAAASNHRVYAPGTVTSVTFNGSSVASCRVGNDLIFPG